MLQNGPNFFVIGAPKAGTTSLYQWVATHPDVYFPRVKEPGYFCSDSRYSWGMDEYLDRYFRHAAQYRARGEATTWYLYGHKAAVRIHRDLPTASHRFIIVLRDPVARAYSMYWHARRTGVETESFERALELEPDRLRDSDVKREGVYLQGYVYCGLYGEHLRYWQSIFDSSQILVLFYDDLVREPKSVVDHVCTFLGLPSTSSIDTSQRFNAAGVPRLRMVQRLLNSPEWVRSPFKRAIPDRWHERLYRRVEEWNIRPATYPPMVASTRARLLDLFAPDLVEVERLTRRDLTTWRS